MSLLKTSVSRWIAVLGLGLAGGVHAQEFVPLPPVTSMQWGPLINVTDVSLGLGHRSVAVGPGMPVTVATDYFVGAVADPCIDCQTQLVFGIPEGTRQCIYSGVGTIQSNAVFNLLAPPNPGIYPLWATPARTPDCDKALTVANGGPTLGLVGVHGDPWVWSWGSVSKVKLNGNTSHKINVFPGAPVTVTTNYSIDAAAGGCPGCISQVVMGVEQGSKACIYNGGGVVNVTEQSFTLTAPQQPGLYPVWAAAQWTFSCDQALSWSNGGVPVAFIEVKQP